MPAVSLLTTNREALTALFDLVASRSWEVAYPAARAGGWKVIFVPSTIACPK